MRIITLLLLLAIFKPVFPQDSLMKSYVVFRTKNVIAYLDGKKITPSHDVIFLKKGMHKIKAWAPTYKLLEDSFMVEKNKTLYSKKLYHTRAYRSYVAKRWFKGISVLVPASLTALYIVRAVDRVGSKSVRMSINFNERKVARERLVNSPNNPVYFREYYDADFAYHLSKVNYERAKKNAIISGSILGAVSLTYVFIACKHKIKFNETPLLSRITPMVDPLGKQASICYHF